MVELGVRAIIVNSNNEVLMTKQKRGIGKGLWSLPGGRVELKETAVSAIMREIKEELAIEIRPNFFTYKEDLNLSTDKDYVTLFFTAHSDNYKTNAPNEILEATFLSFPDIEKNEEIGLGHKEVIVEYIRSYEDSH